MITKTQLEEAPMWTLFYGPAEDPGVLVWDIFYFTSTRSYPEDILEKIEKIGAELSEPERDDEASPDKDDIDAALAFLRAGGVLCKVPDEEGSKYWRLLVVPEGPRMEPKLSKEVVRLFAHENMIANRVVAYASDDRYHYKLLVDGHVDRTPYGRVDRESHQMIMPSVPSPRPVGLTWLIVNTLEPAQRLYVYFLLFGEKIRQS